MFNARKQLFFLHESVMGFTEPIKKAWRRIIIGLSCFGAGCPGKLRFKDGAFSEYTFAGRDGLKSSQAEGPHLPDRGSVGVQMDYRSSPLYATARAAQAHLKDVELQHEQFLVAGGAELIRIGREYAAALHDYSRSVMAWLSWLEAEINRERPPGPGKKHELKITPP